MDHTESGRYFAICRPANPERPPYLRGFDFVAHKHADGTPVSAEWYFLNRLDAVSCLELLLPATAFENVTVYNGLRFEPCPVHFEW